MIRKYKRRKLKVDLMGKRFGKLLVIGIKDVQIGKKLQMHWVCRCDCGNEVSPRGYCLTHLGQKSCGCSRMERLVKHGMYYSPFYTRWRSMNTRCNNPNHVHYKNYGGRGIKVLWNSFEEFVKDMHLSFLEHRKNNDLENTRIERIDNNGNYCKENCRWATIKEQCQNTRHSKYLTFNNITKTSASWAESLGMSRNALYARLKCGWSIDKALTTPVQPRGLNSP